MSIWGNALNLSERKTLFFARVDAQHPESLSVGDNGDGANPASDENEIDLLDLIHRWRAQRPFDDDNFFRKRLRVADVSFDDFIDILSLTPSLSELRNDRRFQEFFQIYRSRGAQQIGDSRGGDPDDWRSLLRRITPADAEHLEEFPAIIGPMLGDAYRRIHEKCAQTAGGVSLHVDDVADALFSHLTGKIARMTQRTLLHELGEARQTSALRGESPEARFQFFCDLIATSRYRKYLTRKYPVLMRALINTVAQWESFVTELLSDFCKDAADIRAHFFANKAQTLSSIRLAAGDDHCDGRSVSILIFTSGDQIVYRPQSTKTYEAFGAFVTWINNRGLQNKLKLPRILSRGDHGWIEYVEHAACANEGEVQDFYYRQGAYLGILYLFNASDFHHENIIAAGPHPMLVDLETLIQPDLSLLGFLGDHAPPGNDAFKSVLGPGLLPQQIWKTEHGRDGVDIGGLTAPKQLSSVPLLLLEKPGTDEMKLVRKKAPMQPGKHMATLNGDAIDICAYIPNILSGFHDIYNLLLTHRDALVADDGPLCEFDDAQIRIILRPTFYYGLQLSDAFHPDMLRNALERDLFFDRLWADTIRYPVLTRVVEAERDAYWRNDIPAFSTTVSGRDLKTCNGGIVPNVFPISARETIHKKLAGFGPDDRARQSWLVEKSLLVIEANASAGGFNDYTINVSGDRAPSSAFLNAATDIADYLAQLSFRSDTSATWFTCVPGEKRGWAYRDAGEDLYSGLPGIALFLAYLGAETGNSKYRDLAEDAWRNAMFILQSGRRKVTGIGAFTGWGSILYAAQHLSTLWDDAKIIGDAKALLPPPDLLTLEDDVYDVVGGAAGFILGAANLIDDGHTDLIEYSRACGAHLLDNAMTCGEGLGWRLAIAGSRPLGGFSHGAAGIAVALLRLSQHVDGDDYENAAHKALRYDRSLYSPSERNWLDVREGLRPGADTEVDENYVVAWCHGAPGIGVSRLLMREMLGAQAPEFDQELRLAADTTLAKGFGRNHSLCHGDFGNLECLQLIASALNDHQLSDACEQLAAGILKSRNGVGWRTGFARQVEPLGLMAGLAGIGYGLLRNANPTTPSILALQSPRQFRSSIEA